MSRRSTDQPINRNRVASAPRVPRRDVGRPSACRPRDMRAAWTLARRTPSARRTSAVEQCLYRCRWRSNESLLAFRGYACNFDKC